MIEQLLDFVVNRWELVTVFVLLLLALFWVESRRAGRKVAAQEAVMLLNKDQAVIVDIREKKEYKEGHIRGAQHIPFASLKDRQKELEKHGDKLIILADKSGQHAGMAIKQLQGSDLNLARLSGGMFDWRGANLPVVTEDDKKAEKKAENKKKGKNKSK